jgi:hypothetical protein
MFQNPMAIIAKARKTLLVMLVLHLTTSLCLAQRARQQDIMLVLIQSIIEKRANVRRNSWQDAIKKNKIITDYELRLIRQLGRVASGSAVENGGTVIGGVTYAGESVASAFSEGYTGLLTYSFYNPATELLTPGPAISSVLYECLWAREDNNLNEFVPVGISMDSASNFGLAWTTPVGSGLEGEEALIRATPFDAQGAPLLLSYGGDNYAVAYSANLSFPSFSAPEPGTLALLGVPVSMLLPYCRKRKQML